MDRPQRFTLRRIATALVASLALLSALLSGPGASLAAPSRAELDAARDRLMELERDFELIVERYNLVHEEVERLRRTIAAAELDVEQVERRMATKQAAAIELATELYKGGSSGVVEAVLSSESLADIEENIQYLEASETEQSRVFESLAVERTSLNRKIASLDRARAKAATEEERLEELRAEIEQKVEDQRDEIARLNELIERAERRAARREARLEAQRRAAAREAAEDAAPAPQNFSPAPAPNAAAATAVEAALSQVGKPYQWAAAGPNSYDCSGLTMWAWAQGGVALPHNSGAQYAATPRVSFSDIEPGDLLFFGSPIHHVGMYIGNGQMVEAPYTGQYVRVVSASRSDFVGAGRPGV